MITEFSRDLFKDLPADDQRLITSVAGDLETDLNAAFEGNEKRGVTYGGLAKWLVALARDAHIARTRNHQAAFGAIERLNARIDDLEERMTANRALSHQSFDAALDDLTAAIEGSTQ
ncbi:hypothetical protein [Primorskyibacter sp. S87]|uniref:hypothetical protein n=1 Tax=Primorskyibacter sp. S87 TaxID=3415126 RepID=UPI003C7C1468